MTNHALLDQVIDSLLAEQELSTETRTALTETPQEQWLRRTIKTGPVPQRPPSSRR